MPSSCLHSQETEEAQDEDLVAAGVMSGIDEAPEAELNAMMEEETPPPAAIRR